MTFPALHSRPALTAAGAYQGALRGGEGGSAPAGIRDRQGFRAVASFPFARLAPPSWWRAIGPTLERAASVLASARLSFVRPVCTIGAASIIAASRALPPRLSFLSRALSKVRACAGWGGLASALAPAGLVPRVLQDTPQHVPNHLKPAPVCPARRPALRVSDQSLRIRVCRVAPFHAPKHGTGRAQDVVRQ